MTTVTPALSQQGTVYIHGAAYVQPPVGSASSLNVILVFDRLSPRELSSPRPGGENGAACSFRQTSTEE
jgi:hypothetical protein